MINIALLKGELLGWAEIQLPDFKAIILVSPKGLVALEPFFYTAEVAEKQWSDQLASLAKAGIKPLTAKLSAEWSQRINQALAKETLIKDLPLDLQGTPFQLAVWAALLNIPKGETLSYSQLAAKVGKPKAVRAIGSACGANPIPFLVPCHRILRSDGSLGGFAFGLMMKQALLNREKVEGKKAL